MRVDVRPRHRNAGRPPEKDARGFLQWIRGRECLAHGHACAGRIEAAHVDYAGDKGMGTKVSDRYSIPLCSFHHQLQHSIGWPAFDISYCGGSEGALIASQFLWDKWPGRVAWERKQA